MSDHPESGSGRPTDSAVADGNWLPALGSAVPSVLATAGLLALAGPTSRTALSVGFVGLCRAVLATTALHSAVRSAVTRERARVGR